MVKAIAAALLSLATLAGCHNTKGDASITADQHMRLGASYEDQGSKPEAQKEYLAALRLEKNYVPALVALGNLSFEDGALVEAELYYRKALSGQPDHSGANNNLAVVYLTRGARLDLAEQHARRALANAGPLRPYVLDTLAHIYMKGGRYLEAKSALDDAEGDAPLQNGFLRQRLAQSRRRLETFSNSKGK